jgi:Macrocin-O-methyltransferase (TylF)
MLTLLRRKLSNVKSLAALNASGGLDIVRRVKAERLSYLGYRKYVQICQTIKDLKKNAVPGDYLEAGCALGGSSIVIGTLKPAGPAFQVYDVFGMIPPPTADDPPDVVERYKVIVEGKSKGLEGDTYYGYIADLYEVVQSNLARHLTPAQRADIHLNKGLLQDTMILNRPVAFAHIDVDWYDPVIVSLQRIMPHLSVGGAIILDDYFDWGGCRKAVDEYLAANPALNLARDDRYGNLKLTRLA